MARKGGGKTSPDWEEIQYKVFFEHWWNGENVPKHHLDNDEEDMKYSHVINPGSSFSSSVYFGYPTVTFMETAFTEIRTSIKAVQKALVCSASPHRFVPCSQNSTSSFFSSSECQTKIIQAEHKTEARPAETYEAIEVSLLQDQGEVRVRPQARTDFGASLCLQRESQAPQAHPLAQVLAAIQSLAAQEREEKRQRPLQQSNFPVDFARLFLREGAILTLMSKPYTKAKSLTIVRMVVARYSVIDHRSVDTLKVLTRTPKCPQFSHWEGVHVSDESAHNSGREIVSGSGERRL